MMTYTVEWAENKNDGWKVVSLKEIVDNGRTYEDVSINKVDKKGREFPNFAAIAPGAQVHGNMWQAPTGKYTLFAPDPKPAAAARPTTTGSGPRGMGAAQERKAVNIKEAQDYKGRGIQVASAMRDSTLITEAIIRSQSQAEPWGFEDFKSLFEKVKRWYLEEWRSTEKSLDVPF